MKQQPFFLLIFFIAFATLGQLNIAHADPLMDRTGATLAVSINGTPTAATPKKKIIDSAGLEPFETYWKASQPKGPLCFKLQTKDARLGKPEKIDIMIHEIHNERPFQRWKNYSTEPNPTQSLADFTSDKGFCPTEYTLTERLHYPTLPPGQYVLRVAYWGVGNWDRQDILFSITE